MKKSCLLSMVMLMVARCALAQTAPAPVLTLKDADALALKHHPEVQAAQFTALASDQDVREQLAAYYPNVRGEATGSAADRDTRIGAGFLSVSRLFNRLGTGMTVDQLITDSGRTPNLVASARLQAQAAHQRLQATRYDILLTVHQAFFEAQRAQDLQQVAQQTVSERQVVANQVTAFVDNKLKSRLDLTFAELNLSQAKLLLIITQNNIGKAFAYLSRALGSVDQKTYTLREEPLPAAPPPSADELVAQAMANRPELAALRLNGEAAAKFQKAERDLSFPTVEGEGVAGAIPVIDQVTLPRVIPDHYEGAIISVTVPIFNGHLFAARRTAAMLRERAADQDLRNEQEVIARDVRAAWADATTAYQRIDVADQALNQAKLALALAQGRYNVGLSSIVELSQAQLSETGAQIEDVNAKYDYQIQNSVMQYQIGALH